MHVLVVAGLVDPGWCKVAVEALVLVLVNNVDDYVWKVVEAVLVVAARICPVLKTIASLRDCHCVRR